jgi:hypothetical protein
MLEMCLVELFQCWNKDIPSTEILELCVQESDKVDGLKVAFCSDDLPNRNLLPKTWV